jgi:hypothetical protein
MPDRDARSAAHTPPELEALREVLRRSHPSFVGIDAILMELAADESVSPRVFDRVCEALFTVLMAYAEVVNANA